MLTRFGKFERARMQEFARNDRKWKGSFSVLNSYAPHTCRR